MIALDRNTGCNNLSGTEANVNMPISREQLAKMIDHTLIRPDASRNDILKLCSEAKKYNFASVCVNPAYVTLAAESLGGTSVRIGTVIAFPFGATPTSVKAFETKIAASQGAQEFDMVINIGALKSKDYELVLSDISSVVNTAKIFVDGSIVKAILETGFLTENEKVVAAKIAVDANVDFVKTCTGFGPSNAAVEDVLLLRKTIGKQVGIKAAGGIRSLDKAMSMIEAGASRIGTSSGVAIIESFKT